MLRFRKWRDHNSRALKDVDAKRVARGVKVDAPLSMQKVLIVTHLDGQFAEFAAIVGGAVAETYFLRAIQYAAEHDGRSGSIDVPREMFGPIVLSRKWHLVPKAVGEKVHDALLKSRICVPNEEAPSVDLSADKSEDKSADPSVDLSRPPSPSPSPSPSHTPQPPNGGGAPASPSGANGHGNGTANGRAVHAPTPEQIRGAQAMAAVIRATKDVAPDRARDARAILEQIEAGTATSESIAAFARRNYGRTECRIAYLSPP